ncbi:MAG: serine/threonine protein phosphatase [Armatimonadetes bacterium]|nr:serine/threonine protein phosphatase [Armatimonadota bacterium]
MPSVYTIGDVHGQYTMLAHLLDALPRSPDDFTVFLGDYIDRGDDSAGVVRRVLSEYDAAPDRTVLLWGNHEDMAAFNFRLPHPTGLEYDGWDWFRNGGTVAMQSWGVGLPDAVRAPCPPDLHRLFGRLQTFYRGADSGIAGMEPYLFVHAGILPGREPENTDGETLLWVREPFLDAHDPSGRVVVHGHTPYKSVRVLPDKIGLDTGAVGGGLLSCLQLPECVLYQVDHAGKVTMRDLPTFPGGAV